jgi:hypothetical protein
MENQVVDALSRQSGDSRAEELVAASMVVPKWLEIIAEGYQKEPAAQALLSELDITGSNDKGYTLEAGIIRYKGRIWLGNHTEAHKPILLALHTSAIGGHSGIIATYHKVKQLFAWPGMKTDVSNYVRRCDVCLKAKPEYTKSPSL